VRLRRASESPYELSGAAHFEVWELSGLTQHEYCENHGLTLKSFGNWRGQLKREAAIGDKAGGGGIRGSDLAIAIWQTLGPAKWLSRG
jgi:hypothetical protein